MNGSWSGPQGGSATGATITSFKLAPQGNPTLFLAELAEEQ